MQFNDGDTLTAAQVAELLQRGRNLSDLASPAAARTALGLGASAVRGVGAKPGTVAAGDDARFSVITTVAGGLNARGLWNATTGLPALPSDGTGMTKGDYYVVSTAGTTSLGGIATWATGDFALWAGSAWGRVLNPIGPGALDALSLPGVTMADDGTDVGGIDFTDNDDFLLASIRPSGSTFGPMQSTTHTTNVLQFGVANIAGATIGDDGDPTALVRWIDAEDFIFAEVMADGTGRGMFAGASAASATSYSTADIAARNASALALRGRIRDGIDSVSARPVWAYSHVLTYGQSLSTGTESWPALSTSQPYDSLMLGGSVHPTSATSTTWVQFGGAAFNALVATVESGGSLLDAPAQAALTPGDTARGETIGEGGANFFRKLQLQLRGLLADATRRVVVSSCGVGNQTIASLSKGSSPEYFNRLRTCATAAKAVAGASTYGIAGIVYVQGESDYTPTPTSYATYLAALGQLRTDIIADVATAIAGQAQPPAMFLFQTTTYSDGINVGRAQLDFAAATPGVYVVAPNYPVTDKANWHLDSNGERWQGQQLGKVMHRVLSLGQTWRPLSPIQATIRGKQVLLDLHVPEPPLAFGTPYSSTSTVDFPDKGFTVWDETGAASLIISDVEIVSDTQVMVTLSATPTAGHTLTLRYADATLHSGAGCLHDSDATVAADAYTYSAGSGQYSGANIPALVGQPYPLVNWCCAFTLTIQAD